MLAELDDDKFLGLKVSEVLINSIWDIAYPRIIKFVFLPFMLYFVCFISYISFFFRPERSYPSGTDMTEDAQKLDGEADFVSKDTFISYILLSVSVVYSIFTLIFEAKQIKNDGLEYFTSIGIIWNFLDISSSMMVIAFAIIDILKIETGSMILVVGGLATFFLWLKLFYFLRLFKPTS
jgi:hypothetical protein